MTDEFPFRKGFMCKQGAKVKNWKRRMFVLEQGTLKYYAHVGDAIPKGIVPLDGDWTARKCELRKRNFGLQLLSPRLWERSFICCADSEKERLEWIRDICTTTALLRKRNAPVAPSGRAISQSFSISTKAAHASMRQNSVPNMSRRVTSPQLKALANNPSFPMIGVTLTALQHLLALSHAGTSATLAEICSKTILPTTLDLKCSFAELMIVAPPPSTTKAAQNKPGAEIDNALDDDEDGVMCVGPPTHFVSHTWAYTLVDLIDALEGFLQLTKRSAEDTFFWIDAVCVNQHTSLQRPSAWWATTFKSAIASIGHTVCVFAPWKTPIPLQRAWCLWELICTIQTNTELTVTLPERERTEFVEVVVSDFDGAILRICNVDSQTVGATLPADREMILSAIEQSVGFSLLNEIVEDKLREWLADTAMTRLCQPNDSNTPRPLGLLNAVASLLEEHGRFEDALKLLRRGESQGEIQNEQNTEVFATTLNCIGRALSGQGRYDEARGYYERALVIIGGLSTSQTHPLAALTTQNIAELLTQQGRIAEAVAMFEQALHFKEALYGPDHLEVSVVLSGLAGALRDQGQSEECIPHLERSLRILKATHGGVHPQVGLAYNNLAAVLREQGRHDEAVTASQNAIEILEKVHGQVHPLVAAALDIQSGTLIDQGKLDEALPLVERCLDIAQRVYGSTHPQVGSPMNNLGRLLFAQGRFDEALAMFQQSLSIFEVGVGREHMFTGNVLTSIAMVLWKQKHFERAGEYMRRSASITAKHVGMQHPATTQLMTLLQMIQLKQACPM